MRPLTRREMITVVGGSVAALLIVLYLFMFLPRLIALTQANRQFQRKAAELSEIRRVAARLPAAERQDAEVKGRLGRLERQIPGSVDVSDLVAEVNEAIRASGVQLVDLTLPEGEQPGQTRSAGQPGTPTGPGGLVEGLQEFPIALRIRATFPQTVAFVKRLETLPRLVAVEALGISRQTDASGLEISLSMETFTLR